MSLFAVGIGVFLFLLTSFSDPGTVNSENVSAYVTAYPYDNIIYTEKECPTCKILKLVILTFTPLVVDFFQFYYWCLFVQCPGLLDPSIAAYATGVLPGSITIVGGWYALFEVICSTNCACYGACLK